MKKTHLFIFNLKVNIYIYILYELIILQNSSIPELVLLIKIMSRFIMNSFEYFIKKELEFSNYFLKKHQIFEERYIKEEYLFLENIWKNEDLIKKIYNVIDDILYSLKLRFELRFLVIGDFLFSLSSSDLSDPSEYIYKINRDSYLNKIKLRMLINNDIGFEWENYLLIHKKLLIGLRLNDVIIKSTVRVFKKRYRKKEWNTSIYFTLNLEIQHFNSNYGLCLWPFVIINIEGGMYSVGTFRNIWKVKRKKKEMESFEASYSGVVKAGQIPFYLSKDLVDINKNLLEKEKNRLLSQVNCSSIEDYKTKITKILKDKMYSYRLFYGNEKISNVSYKDIFILKLEIIDEYKNTINLFQQILSFSIIEKFLFFNIQLFLPCFMDNRWRQYYATLLSPTFYIIFRYLYEFYIKKNKFKKLKESRFYLHIIKHEKIISKYSLKNEEAYALLVLLIEVGKFFIKKGDIFISTEKIISLGLEQYENKNLDIKFEDILYLNKIYHTIDKIIKENKIDYNTIIFKDATSSGLQNYGILLKYKDDKLKYLNIDSEEWCDTYSYLINKYLKDESGKYFKRKYLKSTLMTIPYNAEWWSCFEKFLIEIRKDGIEYRNFNEEEKKKLINLHKNFYNEIKKNIKKEFYINETGPLIIFKYNKWTVVNINEYKINYKKAREKYKDVLYMISEDNEATQKALEANNMQFLDASLVGHLLNKLDLITIHDCFGVRLCELHLLIEEINLYYSKHINKTTFSPFIII